MTRKLHKIIILSPLFVFLKQNIIAYEYEFVGFIDHDRPRLTDNPASISQMDEDYLEIEPPFIILEMMFIQNECIIQVEDQVQTPLNMKKGEIITPV